MLSLMQLLRLFILLKIETNVIKILLYRHLTCMTVYPKVSGLAAWRERTANGTALCHYVQLYGYSVSQSSEFCAHNPLCCF
jgi:hypothetical protein